MNETELYTRFEGATKVTCVVDHIAYSGSAFAGTEDQQGVFINPRIVGLLSAQEGDRLVCWVVPNYEDKRASCAYRAVRAEKLEGEPATLDAPPVKNEGPQAGARHEAYAEIIKLLEQNHFLTTFDLSELLGTDSLTTSNLCRSLHRDGKICRADVYRQGGQIRASMVVWAIHPNVFNLSDD